MKWLGQHIWDFISRFRSDVYLEGTDSGTIASGGNLGLDSNNKVVKSASPSGTIDLTSEVTGTLPVGSGGTGATTLADNSILTGTGTSAITAESSLTYSGEILQIGNDDNGSTIIARAPHSDGDGGVLGIFGGNATSGQTNKNGGDLQLRGGSPTGSGTFGDITFWSGDVEGSGTSLRAATQVAGAISTAATSTDFILYEKAGASTDDYFKISCAEHGATTITTVDDNAAAANLNFVVDGAFNVNVPTSTFTHSVTSTVAIKDTANSGGGGQLALHNTRNDGAGSAGDYGGSIRFYTNNDASEAIECARISGGLGAVDDGSEEGKLEFHVASYDGELTSGASNAGLVLVSGNAEDEVDVTIGNEATSVTTIAGTLTMGSTAAMTNAGLLSVANQSNITGVGTITSGTWTGTAVADGYVADDLTISGGTVNNSIIGGTTAAAIKGTTIDATTDFTIGTTVITDDSIAMDAGSIVMTPSTDDTVTIAAATNGALNITTVDDAAAAANVTITADGTAELAGSTVTLDSAGDIELEVGAVTNYINAGGIYRGGNIGPISDTFIPLMPVDFVFSTSERNYGTIQNIGISMSPTSASVNYHAQKIIPKGYTASSCVIQGVDADGDARCRCFVTDLTGTSASPVSSDTAIVGNTYTMTFSPDIVGDGEKICTIFFNPGDTTDIIYGGKIFIAKTT